MQVTIQWASRQPSEHPARCFSAKGLSRHRRRNKEDIEDVRREVQILHHLGGHPNITLLKGAYEDKYNVHLVMELCSGGELFDRIVSRGHYRCRRAARSCSMGHSILVVQVVVRAHHPADTSMVPSYQSLGRICPPRRYRASPGPLCRLMIGT